MKLKKVYDEMSTGRKKCHTSQQDIVAFFQQIIIYAEFNHHVTQQNYLEGNV